ncbi:hypothetical protein F5Y14DRAFT_426195 [Nemania sp. NC0429]|nr:hypothetical protein F5Y14DRAFT_426195 [Nemania sp. NC0429]
MDYVKARGNDMVARSRAAFEVVTSQNPEKIRAILNLLFVPEFKPTFEDDSEDDDSAAATSTEFHSGDLIAPSVQLVSGDPGGLQNRYPYRLIDLDTKELVVLPDIGTLGQYCILSHSWKFPEVTYRHFTAAKSKNFTKVLAAGKVVNVTRRNDVEATRQSCWSELVEQEEEVKRLVHESDALSKLGAINDDEIIGELLRRLKDVREAERGSYGQDGEEKIAKASADSIAAHQEQQMEIANLRGLLADLGLKGDALKTVVGGDGEPTHATPNEKEVAKLQERKAAKKRQASNIEFFSQYGHIRNALDKLVNCVTLCRSMIKIEQSIERCKEVFDRNCFPKTEKRYVWIDTCCINKDDSNEYVRSISAMGDWYKNAQFCLVHLDTRKDFVQEWLDDWEIFSPNAHKWLQDWDKFSLEKVTPKPNIATYRDIHKPQWSTRAWTLQELVMSKTTFYVNSSWAFLDRPIGGLGYWYYLCPFVSLYTELDTKNPFLGVLDDGKAIAEVAQVLEQTTAESRLAGYELVDTPVGKAQRIIEMLDAMDFHIRGDIDLNTARPRVMQAVNATASTLGANTSGIVLLTKILDVLKPHTKAPFRKPLPTDPTTVKHVIGILLKCIVALTEQLIQEDREYIADFGNARGLGMWQRGLISNKFATSKAMALMSTRDATEEIDRAYGLMGMLGVRFPTFQAEGLTKALSRLLDEVVTTSNDVSVFNWTGKQYGSPIRGRSLYPSVPEAYVPSEEESRMKGFEKRLAELLQIERYECLNDFEQIQGMLLGVLELIKSRQVSDDGSAWIKEILKALKRREFKDLRPHIINISKILKYVETKIGDVVSSAVGKGPEGVETEAGGSSQAPRPVDTPSTSLSSFTSSVKIPSMPKDGLSFKAPKFGSKKSEHEKEASPAPSSRGIGKFKSPSLKGFGLKTPGSSVSAGSPKGEITQVSSDSQIQTPPQPLPATPASLNDEAKRLELKRTETVNTQVISYLRSVESADHISESGEPSKLPPELKDILASIPERKFGKPKAEAEDVDTMISPNPILVKSSGIEGLFDIQRVVVTIPQISKLRRQIKTTIGATQNISGWCSISTGFAVVFVGFSCPKNILEKELDVVQTVEAKILKHEESNNDGDEDEDGEVGDLDDAETAKAASPSDPPKRPGIKRQGTSALEKRLKSIGTSKSEGGKSDQAKDLLSEESETKEAKQERKRVSRMIKFVQEPALSLVAGEWVLARFSGVPGAKWFLCYLDMGSSGGDYYGHRIATDEINFRNASPELGLMRSWEKYMMKKKYRLCSLIQKLLESKDRSSHKALLQQDLASKITERINQGKAGVAGGTAADEMEESDADSETEPIADTLKAISGLAVDVASAGIAETFYERWASRLEKSLDGDVLKEFPVHLQVALKSLDDNKSLMPSMYHSAKRIHMF